MNGPAHAAGIAVVHGIAELYGVTFTELRLFAAAHLLERNPDIGEIGSSDVSIHLADLALHEPEVLREEAARLRERDELVERISRATGNSKEQTLENLRRLLS